jgi:hypothetical protein
VSESHWQSFKRTGFSQQRTNPDYWKLLIPGVGEAPVISYLLFVSLFAVVIGPINYLLLDRARRLYLLLVTVPAGAVLVTASLFAFAVVSDGLTMRLRVRSFADLDQQTGRAAVWSRQSYYAAIAPSRGLRFPEDTTVFPIVYEPGDSHHDKSTSLVWDGEQQLRGGYLSSRTASQFMVCRATNTKEKLVVREGADSSRPLTVENHLATNIKYLLLRDRRGDYFFAKSIRDKAAFRLNDWPPPSRVDATTRASESYGYDASWTVIRSIVDEVGKAKMQDVFAAAAAYASPSDLVPGTATNTSPRLTFRLSAVTPAASMAPVRASSEASPVRSSESVIGLCGGCNIRRSRIQQRLRWVLDAPLSPGLTSQFTAGPWPK